MSGNFALANPINFTNSVVTLGGTNRIFFAGPITVTGNNQFNFSTATFFSGAVSGPTGSVNVISGTLVMQNPNNTYGGGTNLGGGNLQVTASDTGTARGSDQGTTRHRTRQPLRAVSSRTQIPVSQITW